MQQNNTKEQVRVDGKGDLPGIVQGINIWQSW